MMEEPINQEKLKWPWKMCLCTLGYKLGQTLTLFHVIYDALIILTNSIFCAFDWL